MKRIFFFILISLSFSISTYCQYTDKANLVNDKVSLVDNISKSTVFITTSKSLGTGTIFLITSSDTTDLGKAYVITAKHVVSKEMDSLGNIISYFDTVDVWFNLKNGTKESRKYTPELIHISQDYVVLSPIEQKRKFNEYEYLAYSFQDIIRNKDIKVGQDIIVAGFPGGEGTHGKKLTPVCQSGMVAMIDTLNNMAIIDVHINLGNSGCPAYAISESGRVYLLGLVYQYQPSSDRVLRIENKKFIDVPANAGLGRVLLMEKLIKGLNTLRH